MTTQARLIAQKQAEALELAANVYVLPNPAATQRSIRAFAATLRAQAAAEQPEKEEESADRMAYEGAREDLLDWKRRALAAEDLNRKFIREINETNGPTFMGEPVLAWRVIEKSTCFVIQRGNEVIASLAGPDAKENAKKIIFMLSTHRPDSGELQVAQPEGEKGPPATVFHDAGAYAQCSYCKRYTLDPAALSDRQPVCACGEKNGWCGSFKAPGKDSQWHGPAPRQSQPESQAQAVDTPPTQQAPVVPEGQSDYWQHAYKAAKALSDHLAVRPVDAPPAPAKDGWMPIESAPAGGVFQVYMPTCKDQSIQTAKWHPNIKIIGNHFSFDMPAPTHWRELPLPPKE